MAPYVLDLEKQAHTVEIEAELENLGDAALLPGYSADVEVVLAERDNGFAFRRARCSKAERVYVLDSKGERVHVEADRELGCATRSTRKSSGVKEGERHRHNGRSHRTGRRRRCDFRPVGRDRRS